MYIGIDGGATKTLAYLGNASKEVISTFETGATNYHSVGLDATTNRIKEIFDYFKAENNVDMDDIKTICFGAAGVDTDNDRVTILNIFNDLGIAGKTIVHNDSVTALAGANRGMNGAIIISGTGSISFGIGKDNQEVRVGGWGHVIDDDGSGYAIGRDGLRKIMEGYDGRGAETKIWDLVKKELNIEHQEELITFIYNVNTQKHDIAKLAPCVVQLWQQDEAADQIIEKTVDDLTEVIFALTQRMGIEKYPLGLCGSVVQKADCIRELLKERVNAKYPGIDIHLPLENAAMGALIMAVENQ